MKWIAFLLALAISGALLVHFHDRFWWPPDEGNFVHVADRIADGEVLYRDVQDFHMPLAHLVNAAALSVFGKDLLSLRYPLALAALLQAALVFVLAAPAGAWLALVASFASTAFGVLLYLDPSANWYATFLIVACLFVLARVPRGARLRIEAAGAAVMLVFLTRQLSGAVLAVGVLAYLLHEAREPAGAVRAGLARVLLALMLLGLGAWIAARADAFSALTVGIWPLWILLRMLRDARTPDRRTAALLGRLALGALVPLLPVAAYFVAHGTLGDWLRATLVSALGVARWSYLGQISQLDYLGAAVHSLVHGGSAAAAVNGAWWIAILAVGAVNGALVCAALTRPREDPRELAWPLVAVFVGALTLFNHAHPYLYFQLAIPMVSVLLLSARARPALRRGAVATVAALGVVAVVGHAAQPEGDLQALVAGQHAPLVASPGLARATLWLPPEDADTYTRLVEFIDRHSAPDEAIFVFPNDASIYFLADRRNPFPFWGTQMGVTSREAALHVITALEADPPRLVIQEPRDKNHSEYTDLIAAWVATRYAAPTTIGRFELSVLGDG